MNPTDNPPSPSLRIGPWLRRTLAQWARDAGYLLLALPVAVGSFIVLFVLLTTSLATAILWVGVPLAVGTLWAARSFAWLERVRLGWVTGVRGEALYSRAPRDATWLRRALHPLRDAQSWRDLAHGVVALVPATATWITAFSWLTFALTGVSYWGWGRYLPEVQISDDRPFSSIWYGKPLAIVVGIFALATMPWVFRALAMVHVGLGRVLLAPTPRGRLAEQVASLERARTKAASAEATALRKLERDLHDGPQQRLVRLGMDIASAERALTAKPAKPGEAGKLLASAGALTAEALAELRALTRGIAPPLLAERGLRAAIESLADRSTVPVAVIWTGSTKLALGVETAAYFAVAEALANVAKHSRATSATVAVEATRDSLRVRVGDDGTGGAHPAKGHGLAGLAERIEGAGGTLAVSDAEGGGTIVAVTLPLK